MAVKINQEQFISNIRAIHGDKYSFDKTVYVNMRMPVIITCVKHQHDFEILTGVISSNKKKKAGRPHRVGSCPKCLEEYYENKRQIRISRSITQPKKQRPIKKVDGKRYYICDIHGDVLIGKKRKLHLGCPTCRIKRHKDNLIANRLNKPVRDIANKPIRNKSITKKTQTFGKSYMPYDELKKLVNSLGISSSWEYRKWRKRCFHEDDTPCNPDRIYPEWISYYDFFGINKHDKMSAGEKRIYSYLQRNNIEFVWQKTFDDCRNINKLPFDFYIPKHNLIIEFDGDQHHRVTNFSKSVETNMEIFERVKKHDTIKTKYCKDNNIKLLRLDSKDLSNNMVERTIHMEISFKY